MHRDAIVELVGGKTLREQQSDNMRKFFTYCKNNFFVVVSNTQLVEIWVKDSNECTLSGIDEHFSLLIGLCWLTTVFEYKSLSLKESHNCVFKRNTWKTSGKVGERICKKTGEVEDKIQK